MRVQALRPAVVFTAVVVVSLLSGSGRGTNQQPFSGVYRDGHLILEIPYRAPHPGSGTLVTELLDPEDDVLARAERRVDVVEGDGVWKQDLNPADPLPLADLMWQRIRYHFQYKDERIAAIDDIRSVSDVLRRPLIRIIGQSAYLSGAHAAIRVIVTDLNNHELPGNSSIHVELLNGDKPVTLFEGRANRHGTVDAEFRFPADLTGDYQLHFVADTPLGATETDQPVHLENQASILLTTEKRMYQPGQTIHVRTLVLDRADHQAVASSKLTFEILDARGNKVFKKLCQTDEYGIASAEFPLADELNLGTYQLHALMGNPEAPTNRADLSFTVDRYVLPKFKVAIDFAAANGKPKRDYRPGDHVTGTLQSNYFFGKPVGNAEVMVKASTMDVQMAEAASVKGRTDKEGAYHFDVRLPEFFAGRLANTGTAPVLIEATVKDTSGHAETHGEGVTVSESSLLINAIPESGALIPGLPNQVFLLASYPDGTPAVAELQVHGKGMVDQTVSTDSRGVGMVQITPEAKTEWLRIRAEDKQGNHVSTSVSLHPKSGNDQVLLRPDRAVYKAGDRIQLSVFSTTLNGAAYLDIVKDGQTILTRDLDLTNGRAELSMNATPEMSGTLSLNVYRIAEDGQTIGDHRMVFVQPGGELRIQAIADAPVYKPGADAHIMFRVTNEHGRGVRAALGLQVVDEAVFALAEQRPGFAKVFFYLEQELLKPRYEIHSIGMPEIVEPASDMELTQQDRAAQALFSATEIVHSHDVNVTYGNAMPAEVASEYEDRYSTAFEDHVADLARRTSEALKKNPTAKPVSLMLEADGRKPRDAWGTPLRIASPGWQRSSSEYLLITSAGMDRKLNTPDDMSVTVETSSGLVYGRRRQSLDIKVNHQRGSVSGVAEVKGTVTDITGAPVENARVTLGRKSTVTNKQGEFQFSAVNPGSYEVEIRSPGFQLAGHWVTLQARDLAVVSGKLQVGSVAQTVEVMAAAPRVFRMFAPATEESRASAAVRFAADSVVTKQENLHAEQPKEETHIRSYFPEALYINPEILTDGSGSASISIPMADSITNWRMAMMASTTYGVLGAANSSIKVFQDFFVDLDLPVTLTQADRVTIPVAIYNYAGQRGEVTLTLEKDDWFDLGGEDCEKTVSLEAGKVGSASFTLEARKIGHFKLKLSAKMNGAAQRQDIVVREIEVVPNGQEQNIVFNGDVDSGVQHTVRFPGAAIPDASKLFVRLYPGPLSQVMEGMDAILSMPGGCFEQTSSSTYPDILALDYMTRTKKLTPEVHAKAEGYIVNGYQRLLTFEVRGGGFSWFGEAPANKILTAYGLMEFNDMSKVSNVDQNVISRTSKWLISQQQGDGSWNPDVSFINEGATNHFNSDELRITGYIVWALESAGYRGPALGRARQYIAGHLSGQLDSYTLAVLANFTLDYAKDDELSRRVMAMLTDARVEKDGQVFWQSEETGVYSRGSSATVETTGLATQALLKWRQSPGIARRALTFISSKKDATGTWGNTQATIMALRALLMASESSGEATGEVQVALNGQTVEQLTLTSANGDLYRQFVLKDIRSRDANDVQISFKGTGGLAYQVVGRYFVPWEAKSNEEPLSIDVAYDRTKLAQSETVNATATIRNNLDHVAKMVMVDLGIPPGFDLLTEDLETFKAKSSGLQTGSLEKFNLTATQAILYFNGFAPEATVKLHFRLRAKYPIRAHTFQSRVYEYYDPSVSAIDRPKQFEVTAK